MAKKKIKRYKIVRIVEEVYYSNSSSVKAAQLDVANFGDPVMVTVVKETVTEQK